MRVGLRILSTWTLVNAFDMIVHSSRIQKSKMHEIHGDMVEWSQEYL